MTPTLQRCLNIMVGAFERLEKHLDPPLLQTTAGGFYGFRYTENSIEQALIQKLARVISGLHAADLLVQGGFVQEQGVIHRTIDEINEDILFLAVAKTNDTVTPLHERYLKAFNDEHTPARWDPDAVVKGPDSPSRKSIRAYLDGVLGPAATPGNAGAAVYRAYSGYVHAASQNVMDMYGGDPPRFRLRGVSGTPLADSHAQDVRNYVLRGFMSLMVVAKAFGDGPLVDTLMPELRSLEQAMGVHD